MIEGFMYSNCKRRCTNFSWLKVSFLKYAKTFPDISQVLLKYASENSKHFEMLRKYFWKWQKFLGKVSKIIKNVCGEPQPCLLIFITPISPCATECSLVQSCGASVYGAEGTRFVSHWSETIFPPSFLHVSKHIINVSKGFHKRFHIYHKHFKRVSKMVENVFKHIINVSKEFLKCSKMFLNITERGFRNTRKRFWKLHAP
jgi:hypothetical protein